jgi:hypothetical protein
MTESAADVAEREDHEVIVAALIEKATSLGDQVTNLLPKPENIISVGVAILVGAITLGVTDKHPVIFVLLPFPLILLYVYLIQANTEMLSRAGHKAFLEEKVNELLASRRRLAKGDQPSRRVLAEESDVAKTLQGKTPLGRASIVLVQSMLMATLILLIGVAIAHLGAVHPGRWKLVFWPALGLGSLALAFAGWEQSHAYERAFDAASRGFRGEKAAEAPLLRGLVSSLKHLRYVATLTRLLRKRRERRPSPPHD